MVTHWPDLPNFRFHSVIGKAAGGHANVWLANEKSKGRAVAIRVCTMDHVNVEAVQNEISVLRGLNHPNIMALESVFVAVTDICMMFPLMDYGSVTDVLHTRFMFGLTEQLIALILRDLLQAVHYLHSRDMVHRAIRCSHILLSSTGRARLSGMRYCTWVVREGKRTASIHDFGPNLQNCLLWLAPEVLQQDMHGYGTKSDIFSIGITVCEMANGFPPFTDMEHMQMLFEKMRGTTPRLLDSTTLPSDDQEHREQRSRRFSNQLHEFTDLCLKGNPEWRWTAEQLLGHLFFKQLKKCKQQLSDLLNIRRLTLDSIESKEVRSGNVEVRGVIADDAKFIWDF